MSTNNTPKKPVTKAQIFNTVALLMDTLPDDEVLNNVTSGSGENTKVIPVTVAMVKEQMYHEIDLLSKKNSNSGKLTKAQEANVALEAEILAYMAQSPNQLFTVTDIIKSCPTCAGMSTQKVSPRMTALFKDGKLTQTKDKGKTLYQFAG